MKRLAVLPPLAFATALFLAQAPPADAQDLRSPTAVPSTSSADAVIAAIEGIVEDTATLQDQLSLLLAELQAHVDERPTRPGRNASEEEIAVWERAMREWQARVDRLEARIDALRAKSEKLEGALEARRSEAAAVRPRTRAEGERLRALREDTAPLQEGLADVTEALKDLMRDSLRRTDRLREILSQLQETTETIESRAAGLPKG